MKSRSAGEHKINTRRLHRFYQVLFKDIRLLQSPPRYHFNNKQWPKNCHSVENRCKNYEEKRLFRPHLSIFNPFYMFSSSLNYSFFIIWRPKIFTSTVAGFNPNQAGPHFSNEHQTVITTEFFTPFAQFFGHFFIRKI
jgi:hypothetical protein